VIALSNLPAHMAPAAACVGAYYSNDAPPPNIPISLTGSSQVVTRDFKYYVKNVLPDEWISSWPQKHAQGTRQAAHVKQTAAAEHLM